MGGQSPVGFLVATIVFKIHSVFDGDNRTNQACGC